MISNSLDDYKQTIANRFGRASSAYHAFATVQKQSAKRLVSLAQSADLPIEGNILEIGCGTGFITQELVQHFPDRSIEVTDLSLKMLQFCCNHLEILPERKPFVSFYQLDGEALNHAAQKYALIIGGFVLQWFKYPEASILKLVKQLQPGGQILLSFPTCHSFSEWRNICQFLHLPFTANPLPDPEALKQKLIGQKLQVIADEISFYTTHDNATEFFRELKAIGAGYSTGAKQLSVQQMKQLVQTWNQQSTGKIQVHHHIAFWLIQHNH
ncbi:MAG TPA: methyltransferase domain-containing protein [Trichocoleus sp.]